MFFSDEDLNYLFPYSNPAIVPFKI